jgi:DNA polymerase I
MSASQAIAAARAAGVSIHLDGDDLTLKASAEPPAAVLGLLSANKSEIVALLASARALRQSSITGRQVSSDLLEKFSVEACLIEDATEAAAAIADLIAETDPRIPIGIDIETMRVGDNGNALDPNRSAIRAAQLYAGGRYAAVIDMTKVPFGVLKPLASARLVAHNALFETRFLIDVLGPVAIDCTMLLNRHIGGPAWIALEALAWDRLGVVVSKEHQTADWSVELTDPMIAYAALDAVLARRLFEMMATELVGATPAYEAAMAAQPAVAMAENRGLCFDAVLYDDFMDRWRATEKSARAELKKAVPDVDFSKPSQTEKWLRTRLSAEQLAEFPKTKTGKLSFKKDELIDWVVDIPELAAYAQMKYYENKQTRHAGLKSLVTPTTGRIHPNFQICGAVTGRMSCKNPNAQSQEKGDWRKCFRASEGKVLVRADFGQIELRIAAITANETTMLEILSTENGDIHDSTAAATMGVSIKDVTKEERGLAKALNFGLLYGMGAKAFRKYAAKPPLSARLTLQKAAELRSGFFRTYPGLKVWQRRHAAEIERRPDWIATTVLGRRVKCAYRDENSSFRFHYTRSLNVPIQGSAADLLHVALGKLLAALAGLDACPVLFVHDEIILEVAEADAEEAARRLEMVMTEAFVELFPEGTDMVDLVGVKTGKTWGG